MRLVVIDFAFNASFYEGYYSDEINLDNPLINIESFTQWLHSRNFDDGFFTRDVGGLDRLSEVSSEYYAPKLAAAVRACNEVTSAPATLSGKTPKKALEIWLRKHANEYGLTSKTAIRMN